MQTGKRYHNTKKYQQTKKYDLMKKKLSGTSGETIAETLVTMIILSLAVLMIAGAVVSSARVNKKADNTQTAFTADGIKENAQNVVISEVNEDGSPAAGGKSTETTVKMYETKNHYFYYESPGQ